MCGRYQCVDSNNKTMNAFLDLARNTIPEGIFTQLSLFEVFPGSKTLILGKGKETEFQMIPSLWGFQGENGSLVINARSESYTMKALFKNALPVLIPCSAYYEWDKTTKIKYRCFCKDDTFFMAGLGKKMEDNFSFVILTKESIPPQSSIHHRMPVLLDSLNARLYLKGTALNELAWSNIDFMEPIQNPIRGV